MDIQNMSWLEDTKKEVDFLIDQLKLQGNEKILDLACGYGLVIRTSRLSLWRAIVETRNERRKSYQAVYDI